MKILAIALSVALTGCSGGAKQQPEPESPITIEPAKKEAASIYDRLVSLAGEEPAFVVASEEGIVVRTEDRILHTLSPTGDDAEYSYDLDLVWLVSDGVLSAIDLREPDPKLIALVRNEAEQAAVSTGPCSQWVLDDVRLEELGADLATISTQIRRWVHRALPGCSNFLF